MPTDGSSTTLYNILSSAELGTLSSSIIGARPSPAQRTRHNASNHMLRTLAHEARRPQPSTAAQPSRAPAQSAPSRPRHLAFRLIAHAGSCSERHARSIPDAPPRLRPFLALASPRVAPSALRRGRRRAAVATLPWLGWQFLWGNTRAAQATLGRVDISEQPEAARGAAGTAQCCAECSQHEADGTRTRNIRQPLHHPDDDMQHTNRRCNLHRTSNCGRGDGASAPPFARNIEHATTNTPYNARAAKIVQRARSKSRASHNSSQAHSMHHASLQAQFISLGADVAGVSPPPPPPPPPLQMWQWWA